MQLRAICVSRDHKWVVCGAFEGASVWDGEMHDKVMDVEGANGVWAVDVSPDSTRFATGTHLHEASIWSITSGERLVGPLRHESSVIGIKFSPTGDHIATACYGGLGHPRIRVFDSHNGDEIIAITTTIPPAQFSATTPLMWSSDGQRVFTVSEDNRIRSFNVSTGSQLAESQIIHDGNDGNDVYSIALASNDKFIATFSGCSISFLDTSTLTQICPVVEGGEQIWSIAISTESSYLATGRVGGKIIIHNLNNILPDSYGPFRVSTWLFSQTLLINYIGIHS